MTAPADLQTMHTACVRPDALDRLSPRQRDVAIRLMRGLSDKLIARELGVAPSTVKGYVRQIFLRAGLTSRKQAWLLVAPRTACAPHHISPDRKPSAPEMREAPRFDARFQCDPAEQVTGGFVEAWQRLRGLA